MICSDVVNFFRKTFENDIAVLVLTEKFKFNAAVASIRLPAENVTHNGKNSFLTVLEPGKKHSKELFKYLIIDTTSGTVAGWGTQTPRLITNELRKVDLPIVPVEECNRNYTEVEIDPDYMLCAGSEEKDACIGTIQQCIFYFPILQHNNINF